MIRITKKLTTDEDGYIFAVTLILLMLGALLLPYLLSFMSTGMNVSQVYEDEMYELYAADAGVEDAFWKLNNDLGISPFESLHSINSMGFWLLASKKSTSCFSFSYESAARVLQVSSNTIKSWVEIFEVFFLLFRIQTWHKSIARSIKKERKVYLFNYGAIEEQGYRFENMVAMELYP